MKIMDSFASRLAELEGTMDPIHTQTADLIVAQRSLLCSSSCSSSFAFHFLYCLLFSSSLSA